MTASVEVGLAIAVLLMANLVVLALVVYVAARGAKAWAEALSAVHGASFAETQTRAARAADDALAALDEAPAPRVPYEPPSEDELAELIRAERPRPGEPTSTSQNEGYGDVPPIPRGGMYATADRLDG